MRRWTLLAAACAALGAGPAPTVAVGKTHPAAAANGLSAKQMAAIDRYVTAEMARQRIPGVEIGIYENGRGVLEKGYGLADIEWGAPVTADTLMQSGSVGKQFAATAIMMLVEQHKIGLDDSIRKYFPDAPESWQAIKIKNLLSHTAGLAEYEEGALAEPGGEFDLTRNFTEDQLVAKVEKLPIEYKVGESWDYRNTDYLLLGIIIHRVTGQFYGDYLHDHIFAPLGMTHTRIISDTDIIPGRASGYEINGGKLKNQAWVSATFNSTADGTLYFNVRDLEHWDRALYGGSLISQASLAQMWTPFPLNDGKPNPAGYGFAWGKSEMNGHRVISHSGAWQGFTCQIARYVDDKLTVVVLTNLDAGHARPGAIQQVVAGLVRPALMPALHPALEDHDPALGERLRRILIAASAGKDVGAEFAAKAHYKFEAIDGPEFSAELPKAWAASPMRLIRRSDTDGVTGVAYRVGPPGDTRVLQARLDASGKLLAFAVLADPDNR
jgi:CubicO group peptidase (beta-lactamase class C family)